MTDPDAYVMLISSLPNPERLFVAKQPPLSRLSLDERLRMLSPDDAAILRLVEDALDWRQLPITVSEQDVIDRGRTALSRIDNETLQLIIRDRLEIRTCVAAVRRRSRGEGPPQPDIPWGFGRWVSHITRHWTDPAFRLDGVFPWLREAEGLMAENDTIALERLILDQSYKQLQRLAGEHMFNFEAVVIYVLKWSIIDRWARYNGEAAIRRFNDLIQAGVGNHAALSFEGEA